MQIKRMLALGALLLSTGCSAAGFALVNLPANLSGDVKIYKAAYGSEKLQSLEIYVPKTSKKTPLDVVVFFYGGRWTSGSKEDYRFVGDKLARQGYVVVIPDYRKYPEVKFPAFAEDAAKAVAWTADHIADYGGDNSHLHLAGHSSGAHIAALITADPEYLKAENKDAHKLIRSFAGLAGPYNFTPDEADLKDMFGPPDRYPRMQVNTYVDGKEAPMLLLYGLKDDLVGPFNHEKLAEKIKQEGGRVSVKTYKDLDHVDMMKTFTWVGPKSTILQDMVNFFRATDGGNQHE